jgi:hypothetical protein
MADLPKRLQQLVETFDHNIEAYKTNAYNEAQLRREFIDPFFQTLGWDVTNQQGWAPAYREVIHEDAIKVGGYTKAPDYCFRIGGVRKFFLEAKKPSIDIRGDPHPAYQLRRYAWSAKPPSGLSAAIMNNTLAAVSHYTILSQVKHRPVRHCVRWTSKQGALVQEQRTN